MKPILCIVGTRPNYMKIAPIIAAFINHTPPIPYVLVHTGQHYDANMEKVFFEALNAPAPDINLKVGAGTHAIQTGEIMKRLDPVVDELDPSCVLVLGDVNSTLGAALVAAKRGLPLIHVESGLRSGDRAMPEEINRIVTDQLSNILFTTERSAKANLLREGIDEDRIVFVGNVMIDSLERSKSKAIPVQQTLEQCGVAGAKSITTKKYVVVTLHRPSNVDVAENFAGLIEGLNHIAIDMPLIFPMHPRTKGNLEKFDLLKKLRGNWIVIPPQGYFEMIGLMRDAFVVCTDSGGIQEETTMLSTPCLTLRENTERPITIEQGTNELVGTQTSDIIAAYVRLKNADKSSNSKRPEFWDGHAAERICAHLWERRKMLNWA